MNEPETISILLHKIDVLKSRAAIQPLNEKNTKLLKKFTRQVAELRRAATEERIR